MSASAIIFYAISALILGAGMLAVTSRKIFRSAIWLLSSLVGIAALYFWMQVEFIAAVQIAVYVGGIVVLIIFSIFLTQQSGKEMPKTSGWYGSRHVMRGGSPPLSVGIRRAAKSRGLRS